MTGLVKAKEYNVADSNIENLGTQLEKDVKKAAADTEDAWKNAGKAPGLQIWRIEKFKVIAWPENQIGQFFAGDSYIVLHTYKKKKPEQAQGETDALVWDVFFWLGSKTSQDEAGTAAYKTVELDDVLGGAAIQHREVEGYETEAFRNLFPKIVIMDGGVDSGFNHVEPEKYRARLLHVKGLKVNIVVQEVPLKVENLNSGDVFIVDAGMKIFQFNGKQANMNEKSKAGELLRAIKDERGGKPEMAVIEEGQESTDEKTFWEILGGKKDIKAATPDDEVKPAKKLFRLHEEGAPPSNAGKQEVGAPAAAAATTSSQPSNAQPSPVLKIKNDGISPSPFNVDTDAQTLRKALKKFFGIDSKVVIGLFGHRTREQLVQISETYTKTFPGKYVKQDIHSKTTFKPGLRALATAMLTPALEYEAECIQKALEGVFTDNETLIEILCSKNSAQIKELQEMYKRKFAASLIEKVQENTKGLFKGDYQHLLLSLLKTERSTAASDPELAKKDAHDLFEAGEGKFFGTDEDKFINILSSRSFAHLKTVFESYSSEGKKHHSIEEAIISETSGSFKNAMLMIVQTAKGDTSAYYANRLYEFMTGIGTNDELLIRMVVTHYESDLQSIKKKYRELHNESLADRVYLRTGGDYRSILLHIIGMDDIGFAPSVTVKAPGGGPISTGTGQMKFTLVAEGKVTKNLFDTNDAFIYDTGFEVFVWIGRGASKAERRKGIQYAQYYINQFNRPQHTPITRILEGGENEVFHACLDA